MDSPGERDLGTADLAKINGATSSTVVTTSSNSQQQTVAYIDNLDGMLAAAVQLNFTAGAAGGTIKATIETSLDQGDSWVEIARLAFATANAERVLNFSALTPRTAPYTPAALSDDSAIDGILGSRMRFSILKAGSAYTGNASLAVRMTAR